MSEEKLGPYQGRGGGGVGWGAQSTVIQDNVKSVVQSTLWALCYGSGWGHLSPMFAPYPWEEQSIGQE